MQKAIEKNVCRNIYYGLEFYAIEQKGDRLPIDLPTRHIVTELIALQDDFAHTLLRVVRI